jgi:hypothetical protein
MRRAQHLAGRKHACSTVSAGHCSGQPGTAHLHAALPVVLQDVRQELLRHVCSAQLLQAVDHRITAGWGLAAAPDGRPWTGGSTAAVERRRGAGAVRCGKGGSRRGQCSASRKRALGGRVAAAAAERLLVYLQPALTITDDHCQLPSATGIRELV